MVASSNRRRLLLLVGGATALLLVAGLISFLVMVGSSMVRLQQIWVVERVPSLALRMRQRRLD
jgi:hypothetical protein